MNSYEKLIMTTLKNNCMGCSVGYILDWWDELVEEIQRSDTQLTISFLDWYEEEGDSLYDFLRLNDTICKESLISHNRIKLIELALALKEEESELRTTLLQKWMIEVLVETAEIVKGEN